MGRPGNRYLYSRDIVQYVFLIDSGLKYVARASSRGNTLSKFTDEDLGNTREARLQPTTMPGQTMDIIFSP
jgi:hypothetical protein